MNKIFKTLKNHRTGAATAVSELQTGRTKGSRLKAVVVAAVVAAATLSSGVEAADWSGGYDVILNEEHDEGTTHVGSGFAFGNKNLDLAAKTYNEDLLVWTDALDPYVFRFNGLDSSGMPTVKLNLNDRDAMSLFEQSQGFDQALVHTTGLTVQWGAYFSVDAENGIDSNIFEQLVEQNKETVARGRYIIGTRAQNLNSLTGKKWENHNSGIMHDSTTFYTATVLSELDIYNEKTLELGVSGAQNWGAHLTGEGGVAYVGGDKAKDVVTIKQLFKSNYDGKESVEEADSKDHLNRPNDYKGATTVTNVTLNLERETSLGTSGILTANNASIIEVKEGALGTLKNIDFTDTALTTAGTSLEVTGDATFAGENTMNVVDYFKVDNKATITSGSLSTGTAAFDAGSLEVTDATLTASSVNVTGNTTVSGKNTVAAETFSTTGLILNANGTLDATGNLTATSANLSAGAKLSAKSNVKVKSLAMAGAAIAADQFTASGSLTLSGANTIETVNGATLEMGVSLLKGDSLEVKTGGLTAGTNVTVGSGAKLTVKDGLSVVKTLTLDTAESETNTSNFSVDRLEVGEKLAFVGNGYLSDKAYTFGTRVSTLNPRSAYDVSLTNANVEYVGQLDNVRKTTLDRAHLTLDYGQAGNLGSVNMQNGQNLLTLKSNYGFPIDNRFSVESSTAEDVIELSGKGAVVFMDNVQIDDNYAGWIRMTGTTLRLPLSNMQGSTENLSVSVGTEGMIVFSDDQRTRLKRLGWADTGKNPGGTIDLSKFDFSNLKSDEAAIEVENLTVNGNGTIVLDESAVQKLTVGTGGEGDSIFDALNGNGATRVIFVTNGFDPETVGGTVNIDIEGDSNDDKKLTGYFGSSGLFTGDNATGAAAKGTWGYGTVFDKSGLSVTHTLTEIELLDGQTLGLVVDGAQYQGVGAKLTGTGTLAKTGSGTLHLLNTSNTWTGSTVVNGGNLVAEAGALGTGALNVGTDGTFVLSGAQDGGDDQVVQTLDVDGVVKIGGNTTENHLTLEVAGGGNFAEGSTLEGGSDATLALNGGILKVTDIEKVASDYHGEIRVGRGATLVLEGNKNGTDVAANLSNITGLGTIVLMDCARHDTTGDFNGLTQVEGGHLVIDGEDAHATSNAKLAMTEDGGLIESKGEHYFNSIDLTRGVLNVGTVQAGDDIASGALHGKNVHLENVTIKVSSNMEDMTVDASDILTIDNVEGKDTWLVKGDEVKADKVTIEGLEEAEAKDSKLMQGDEQIGTIRHALELVTTYKGVGFKTRADSMNLTGTLNLEGSLDQTADTTLDLTVTGSDTGVIHIAKETVWIDKENSYGALQVDQNASVILNNTQTLTQGGRISGNVNGDAGLNVTGGTLTIDGMDEDGFDVHVGSNASLAFNNLKGSPNIFMGAVTADAGSTVSFSGTTGNFKPVEGKTAYELTNGSSVTFSPYVPEKDGSFEADTVSVDGLSSAYFDVQGEAGATDLSKISGKGRVVLGYAATPEAVGTLDVTAIGSDFAGTLAFTNAQATIGTDESVKNSVLNKFATEQGELEVGAGSTLVVKNQKDRAEDGSFTPHAVELAGDLTISDRATLDFTAGVFEDHGTEHLGNSSGLSVNALDLNGNRFVVVNSGEDSKITVQARIDKLDFGTGLPSNGEYHGSILDMLGETPDYPVLTVIENIRLDGPDKAAAISAIASSMVLEGVDEDDEKIVKFWQPNWDPESEHETVYVANVTTGVKLVGVKNENDLGNIAIGAGITKIDIVQDATLRMDEAASAESGTQHIVDAEITGDGHVVVMNSLGTAGSYGIVFAGGNSYTGETRVDLGAKLTAANANAFGGSSLVRVGTMETGDGTDPAPSTLKVSVAQSKTDAYANALKVNALTVGANGTVELAEYNDLLLTGNGTSTFAKDSVVKGDDSTTIGLADGNLTIKDLKSISGFKGAFRVNTGASVNFTVADGSYTWTNDVLYYTDARSRAIGAGEFVKSGAGTLVIDGTQGEHDLSGMNLVVTEGTMKAKQASILGLTTRAGTVVDVDGIFTTHNLTADAGSVFNLNVVTGKVKEGESSSTKPIWGLGENGSDGIRVTGTASGTLNLAVTPKEVGAEESIQLVDANRAADGFTVNLVDEKGAKLEGLTVGAYDYTLVRKDDAQNGTDVFLSSIIGEDEIRNTTVTAGSYIGVAAAAQLFDISLHDRMSNRSWLTANADGSIANSFWVLETVSNERYGDSTGQIDVHDTASTTTVGSDILSGLAAGGTWYAGAMFSYATQDTKSRSNRTALESRADTDAWAAGLYAGWQLNGADRTGPYVDGWILWTDAESDVKGVNVSETVDGNGLSASIEAGWGFKALSYNAHGQAGDIYVEPHVSVTWFGYEADDVSNDVHDVTFEGKDNIRTKLGVKTYAFGKNSGGFSPYVELNWIHNTETYGVTMSNVTVEQVGAEDQGEVRAGADWRINDAFTVWGHFGITSGSDGYSNREASLGVRYNF